MTNHGATMKFSVPTVLASSIAAVLLPAQGAHYLSAERSGVVDSHLAEVADALGTAADARELDRIRRALVRGYGWWAGGQRCPGSLLGRVPAVPRTYSVPLQVGEAESTVILGFDPTRPAGRASGSLGERRK